MQKTFFTNGGADAIENARCLIKKVAKPWKAFKIALSAEYLGFLLGPQSCCKQWNKVLRKASDFVVKWKALNTGFFFNLLAANVFGLSLFGYLGQLVRCAAEVDDFLEWMKRKFLGRYSIH